MSVPWYLMAKGKGGGGYKTASGPIVSISDALAAPLRSLRVGIDPIQDLHGYDSPWPAGGGANKANLETATVRNDGTYGMSVTIDKTAETITMSGTWTGAAVQSWRFLNTPDIDTSLSIKAFGLTSGSHISSVTQDGAENRLIIQLNNMVSGTAYTIRFKLFAYSGTAPTSWAPYSNECPISGWSAANLWRTGKNLIDITSPEKDGYYTTDGAYNSAAVYSCYLVPCKPNTTYTVSGNFAGIKTFWDADLNFISGINQGTGETKTFTTPSGALFFRISIFKTDIDGTQQIELGSTHTAYTPYTGNQFTIQLGQTVYGGTLDVLSGVLTVDRAMAYAKKVDFPNKGTATAMDYRNAVPLFPPTASMTDWNLARQQQISNMAKIANPYSESSYGTYIAVVYTSANNTDIGTLRISEDLYQSMTDDDAIEIVYKLLNPITYPLSSIAITTLAGQNVMWADCGDVTVEYLSAGGANPDLMKLAVAFMGRK